MILSHIYRFMIRNYKFTLIWIITLVASLLFLNQLHTDIIKSKDDLANLSDSIQVSANLTIDSKSIDFIPYELIEKIKKTDYIHTSTFSSIYTSYLIYPEGDLAINTNYDKSIVDYYNQGSMLATSALENLYDYPYIIDESLMNSLESYNWILVNEWMIDSYNLSIGDTLILAGEYIPSNYYEEPEHAYKKGLLNGLNFTLIGTFNDTKMNTDKIMYIANNEYILNNYRRYIIHETIPNEYYPILGHQIIEEPHVNTASFTLKNKLFLDNLIYILDNDILNYYPSYRFIIDDNQHEIVTLPIQNQIITKENTRSLIIGILILIHIIIIFISIYKKIPLLALLRISGNKRHTIFMMIIAEYLLSSLIASAIFLMICVFNASQLKSLLDNTSILYFYISYITSTIFSTMLVLIKSPMQLLLKKE